MHRAIPLSVFLAAFFACRGDQRTVVPNQRMERIDDKSEVASFLRVQGIVNDGVWIPSSAEVPNVSRIQQELTAHLKLWTANTEVAQQIRKYLNCYKWQVAGMVLNGNRYLVVQGHCGETTLPRGHFIEVVDGGETTIQIVLEPGGTVVRLYVNPIG